MNLIFLSTTLIFFTSFIVTYGHSHLADPLPTRELHCRVGAQQGRDCFGPCPRNDRYGRLNGITEDNPAETWGRGQMINARWHRDNHDGTGFVRLTLVPVEKMMDKGAHDRYAFAFLCMNSGPHSCPDRSYDVCGNDEEGMAWQARVQVPTSYPDGVYAFGWSWYGGGDYRAKSFFGDYYSCSFIRISGGVPITEEYAPVYDGSKCISSTDRLGICWKEPCHVGDMYEMIPFEFNGRTPHPIRRSWIEEDSPSVHNSESESILGESQTLDLGPLGVVGDTSNSGSSSFVSSGSTSVSLGARGGQHRDRNPEVKEAPEGRNDGARSLPGNDNRVFKAQATSTGALGVYFLNFVNWEKIPIHDGGRYRMSDFPKGLTVEAFYKGSINFVDFFVDGKFVRREKDKPFVMTGNRGRQIFPWRVAVGSMVKLQVSVTDRTGYSEGFEADFQFD